MKTIFNIAALGLSLLLPTYVNAWSAVAVLKGTGDVSGVIYFDQSSDSGSGVHVTGNITGLTPNAQRGFHVHEFGDLTNGCNSTGTHYNPLNQTHGAPRDSVRHVGDLGNVQSDDNGVAVLDFTDSVISLSGDYSIVGRGVVVHVGTDDLGLGGTPDSLTTGNAGGRAACGVIGWRPTPPSA